MPAEQNNGENNGVTVDNPLNILINVTILYWQQLKAVYSLRSEAIIVKLYQKVIYLLLFLIYA